MSKHVIASGIIESRIDKMLAGDTTSTLEAETRMAIEMAYALGAIDCQEHTHYVRRINKIVERAQQEFMDNLRIS